MKASCKVSLVLQDKLFIGTDEHTAKLATAKGLNPPLNLTDVYPTYFCSGNKWGIISVSLKNLFTDMLAPFQLYLDKIKPEQNIVKNRKKWKESLKNCGICTYLARIPPNHIEKVSIFESSQNILIKSLLEKNPMALTLEEHTNNYKRNLALTRWLSGELVLPEDIYESPTYKLLCEVSEKIMSKNGLDIYYINDGKNWKSVG